MDGYPPYPPAYSPPQPSANGQAPSYPLTPPIGTFEPPPPYSPPTNGFNQQPGFQIGAQPSLYTQQSQQYPQQSYNSQQNSFYNSFSPTGNPPQNYALHQYQQPAYNPLQPGFIPQQPGYAAQQSGYNPQQSGISALQPSYNSQQNGALAVSQDGLPPKRDSVSQSGVYPSLSQSAVPARPAPPPPRQPSLGFGDLVDNSAGGVGSGINPPLTNPDIGFNTDRSSSVRVSTHVPGPWKDTPLPAGMREVWLCMGCQGVYFLQEDGIVVSPTKSNITIKVYVNDAFDFSRCPSRRGSTSSSRRGSASSSRSNSPAPAMGARDSPQRGPGVGFAKPEPVPQQFSILIDCPGIFRIKLSPIRGHSFLTSARDYLGVVDLGTYPCRSVVIHFPRDLDAQDLDKLLGLLGEYAVLTTEAGGVISTVSSTLESAFNFTSKKSSDLLKDATPSIHKSTKFFRKGGGSIVRLGGSLVSKGINLVAETVSPTPHDEKIQMLDPRVNQLKSAVAAVKEAVADGKVSVVSAEGGH